AVLGVGQGGVERLVVEGGHVRGVESQSAELVEGRTVILTTATFLKGLVQIALKNYAAGRAGDFASIGLSEDLAKIGFRIGRLKTGTCPRLDSRTIHYHRLQVHNRTEPPPAFPF